MGLIVSNSWYVNYPCRSWIPAPLSWSILLYLHLVHSQLLPHAHILTHPSTSTLSHPPKCGDKETTFNPVWFIYPSRLTQTWHEHVLKYSYTQQNILDCLKQHGKFMSNQDKHYNKEGRNMGEYRLGNVPK